MTEKELEKVKGDFWEKIRPKTELELSIEKINKLIDTIQEELRDFTKTINEVRKKP